MHNDDDLLRLFHEEVDELLADLESVLLSLESGGATTELVAEAFRLLHTLKGTCGMYDFKHAAALAHEVETLFARVRDGSLLLNEDLLELALKARDSIAVLVSGDIEQSEAAATAARAITQKLMDNMQELAVDSAGSTAEEAPESDGETATYSIDIRPRGDLFVRGVTLTGVLNDLALLGETETAVNFDDVPPLDRIDPTQCYLSLSVRLRSGCTQEQIADALMFLDEGEWSVKRTDVTEQASSPAAGGSGDKARSASRGTRVSDERLDELVNLVGELVTAQAWLQNTLEESEDERLVDMAEQIALLAHSLRESVLGMRMVPIGTTYGRFTRYVRDLAKELGKQVVLETDGSSAELDRGMIERIEEPLLHIIRNALDHGIESPSVRRAAGKSEIGHVKLSAFHSGGSMFVRVSDDGKGIDIDAVRARAIAEGTLEEDERLDSQKLAELVLSAGFSTSQSITAVSGRGVGLDVVRATIEDLQGSIELETQPGMGVTVTMRLPLTLAIIDGLLVAVGDESYVLPLTNIEECLELKQQDGWAEHGRDLFDVRGEVVPFARLRDVFGVPGQTPGDEIAVIADVDGERFGLIVDRVLLRLQVVIKSLGRAMRRAEGVLGATMLGDGSVALVVDVAHVARLKSAEHVTASHSPQQSARGEP